MSETCLTSLSSKKFPQTSEHLWWHSFLFFEIEIHLSQESLRKDREFFKTSEILLFPQHQHACGCVHVCTCIHIHIFVFLVVLNVRCESCLLECYLIPRSVVV